MDSTKLINFVNTYWEQSVIPGLSDFISIPCVSAAYDANWQQNGYLATAAKLMLDWAKEQNINGLQCEIIQLKDKSPFLFIEVKGDIADTVLFYGHLDKMPAYEGWDEGLGAWQPTIKNGKLYGRGSADNGHALFSALTAIKALQELKQNHPRCVIIIEGGEESGSPDLPTYLDLVFPKIGSPKLIFCLDTDCNDHDYLWFTNSIRGLVIGELQIEVLKAAVHSGAGGGIIPSPFTILQNLLNRIQDPISGKILLKEAQVEVLSTFKEQIDQTTKLLGNKLYNELPFGEGVLPLNSNLNELILNRDWRAAVTITGIEGIPSLQNASNVILPKIVVKLSLRIPPTSDPTKVIAELKNTLEQNPPFNAKISFTTKSASKGWAATDVKPWLQKALKEAGKLYTNKDISFTGIGGAVPTVILLSNKFPQADLVNLGFGGSYSNCHGPNEFLPLNMAKALNCVIAHILSVSHSMAY